MLFSRADRQLLCGSGGVSVCALLLPAMRVRACVARVSERDGVFRLGLSQWMDESCQPRADPKATPSVCAIGCLRGRTNKSVHKRRIGSFGGIHL